ncbi:MAG: glycosyltransferase [Opitutales bacterium]|nr:glycosyltransferase [Opitutales bacterium]
MARSTPALAKSLSKLKLDISILFPETINRVASVEDPDFCLFPLPHSIKKQKLWAKSLNEILEKHFAKPPFIIHHNGMWLPFSRAVISQSREQKIPLILSPRGMLEPWALNKGKWKKRLAWWLYQKSDLQKTTAFHATAYSEAESIRRLGFTQPIAVIPNGVTMPSVNQEPRTKNQEQRTALFLSRINPKKGLPMLLDAWKKVAPEDWQLVLAGNDDSNHLPTIEKKIAELGLQKQVTLAGPLFDEAKDEAFQQADLFILPSYSENFGIVVAEALSHEVPVLTTTGCPWEELETHQCGWWVEPTPEGIANGLSEALQTATEELSNMGARGRQLVEQNYQWHAIAEKMHRFYKWILEGGEKPEFVV